MSFLGPVGSLIPVKCASQLTVAGGRQVSFTRTLGKQKAFLGKVSAREWSVDIGLAKPHELSGLRWLAENVNSPMVWYAPDAVVGNVLTPDAANFSPESHTGLGGSLVEVESVGHIPSVLADGRNFSLPWRGGSLDPIPVVPGRPVTVSVWLRGGDVNGDQAQISVIWRDIIGSNMNTESTRFPATGELVRRSVTLTPPAGAVSLSLQLWCVQAAGVAVTLTDDVGPYSPGKGARRVIAHGLSESLILVTQDRSISSASFTVTEVG